jgi:hypothetical protein
MEENRETGKRVLRSKLKLIKTSLRLIFLTIINDAQNYSS